MSIRSIPQMAVAGGLSVALAGIAGAQCPAWQVISPTPWEDGYFGATVTVRGDRAVVSDPSDHTFCPFFICYSGAVHVFRRQGGAWDFEATLYSSVIAPYDSFGLGMAFDGRRIAAGSPGDDTTGLETGAVYLFEHDGAAWRETGVALPPEPQWNSGFATEVALEGDTLVVGARNRFVSTTVKPGVAFVYLARNGRWDFVQEIVPPDVRNNSRFGFSMALDGDWLVIGAPQHDEHSQIGGAAYVYQRQPDRTFEFRQKLAAPWLERGEFGWGVDVRDTRIAIGAPNTRGRNGTVFIYDLVGEQWEETAVMHSDPELRDAMGQSVALSRDALIVGAPWEGSPASQLGAAYVFQRRADGSWQQTGRFVSPGGGGRFGEGAATDGATAIIGAPVEPVPGGRGAAYLYDLGCLLCRADLDGDGALTFFDFLAFQNLFAARDLRADFDGDGELTFFDFLAFQAEFAAGCG